MKLHQILFYKFKLNDELRLNLSESNGLKNVLVYTSLKGVFSLKFWNNF